VHFPGIDYVGPLPGELQRMTVFSAHPRRLEAGGRGEGAGQVHHRAGRGSGHQEARPGASLTRSMEKSR